VPYRETGLSWVSLVVVMGFCLVSFFFVVSCCSLNIPISIWIVSPELEVGEVISPSSQESSKLVIFIHTAGLYRRRSENVELVEGNRSMVSSDKLLIDGKASPNLLVLKGLQSLSSLHLRGLRWSPGLELTSNSLQINRNLNTAL